MTRVPPHRLRAIAAGLAGLNLRHPHQHVVSAIRVTGYPVTPQEDWLLCSFERLPVLSEGRWAALRDIEKRAAAYAGH
ncbi:hypothetical protein M8312_11850 [Sphingomonas sp. KRR8]|uniref:hypothetical protein n=1 Tax=Sphingomonas sp. KRR8 TaxID=2942996 RepID=UPI0020219425|nr:hypothetical protein [Sphingomonas sp. KRR8]URD60469.1 hypothetical protein M8312_11850 [Sphingomonas sp. KRR8]